MRVWLEATVGLLIWLVHFTIAYAVVSISLQTSGVLSDAGRLTIAGASLLLFIIAGAVGLGPAWSDVLLARTLRRFGCLLAALAIVFQSLPLILQG